jgi:hypothetical protein
MPIKPRRIWVVHVAHIVNIRNAYKILSEKGKDETGREGG